jgi:hypothetical protein
MAKAIVNKVMAKGDDKIESYVTRPGKTISKMTSSETGKNIGGWAFMIGFIIALIAGIIAGVNAVAPGTVPIDLTSLMIGILVVIGIIVGMVNISQNEVLLFLVSAMALIVTPTGFSALNAIPGMGAVAAFLTGLTTMIAIFVAPAAVIVAVKAIYATAREA